MKYMYAFHYALFFLIYQIRYGLSSVKFSLVWKISFSGRFYWFLCNQSGVGMLFVTLKFRKKKKRKNNFLQIFRDTIMIGTRDIMGTFSSGSSGLPHIHLQYHKKTVWILVYWSEVEQKSIVKLKVVQIRI